MKHLQFETPTFDVPGICCIEGWVAAAVAGAGVVGAVGSVIAGSEAKSATNSATNASIAEQNKILSQQQSNAQPYLNLGNSAIGQYESLLGLPGGNGMNVQQTLAATPGYQFAQQQGLAATKNQAAATFGGGGPSGNTLQAIDQFSTGLADSTYQNAVQNAQGAVGIGQAAAAGQAANLGNAGSNISTSLLNQGNTLAGIDANTIAGISGAASNSAGQYATYNTLQNLINPASSGGGGGGGNTGANAGPGGYWNPEGGQ